MFQGIDPIAQIIIAITILIVFVIFLLIVWKRGLKFGLKKGLEIEGIEVIDGEDSNNGKKDLIKLNKKDFEIMIEVISDTMEEIVRLGDNASLQRKMDYAEDKFPMIIKIQETMFYFLSKKRMTDLSLTENEDLDYYQLTVSNYLYSDNGYHSVKTIVRKYLRSKEYLKQTTDYEKFLNDFTGLIIENGRKHFNMLYKSEVTTIEGKRRKRIVSAKELYDRCDEPKYKTDLEDIFREIFDNAKKVDLEIGEEKESLYINRRLKLNQLVGIGA